MIVSFYSFKGGVGRTQACANIAAFLCFFKHRKILLWDWDFEAPGLHHYFGLNENNIDVLGTLELFESHIRMMHVQQLVRVEDIVAVDKTNIISLCSSKKGGKIDLLPAGKYNEDYAVRLQNFNWSNFIKDYDGIVFINELKKQLLNHGYDYILIDARSGLSDYAGICNVLLPDVNIVIISPNEQNFIGSKKIVEQIRNHPYVHEKNKEQKRFIIPILSRLDTNHEDAELWSQKFLNHFAYLLHDLFIDNQTLKNQDTVFQYQFLSHTFLPYTYSISVGENLFFNEEITEVNPVSFRKNYANLGSYLENIKNHQSILGIDTILDYSVLKVLEDAKNIIDIAEKAQSEGKNVLASKYYEEVIKMLSDALIKNEELYSGWFLIGKAYIGQKEFEFAHEAFYRSLGASDLTIEAYIQIGYCLFEIGNYKEADKAFEKALENPSISDELKDLIAFYQGRILLDSGRYKEGLNLLNALLRDFSEDNFAKQEVLLQEIEGSSL